jgi:flavin-dependent dehydrogenase
MHDGSYDALIIGGGPGGSTTATYLAKAGKRVLVLEKETFPRFHIGESLLPYNRAIFEEMGVLPVLMQAGFPRKLGAQFLLGNGQRSVGFVFRQGKFTRETEAIQVERAKFDHLLLNHARSSGAEVREGITVTRFESQPEQVLIEAKDRSGERLQFRGGFLIDASGRGNFTGNQEGLREIHPRLKKLALFGHFTGVKLDPGEKGGDTVIVRLANKWFWIIPISAEKTSVGCVMDQEEFARSKSAPDELFRRIWQSSPPLCERMACARLVSPIQTTSDFSYHNRKLCGPRLLRVGDAAGFLDPIFSSGVFLAMYSGRLAAKSVLEALVQGNDGDGIFQRYEKRVFRGLHFYWEMVENFYTTPFMEVFLSPREKYQLASAVNAALAGELEGSWNLRWRMRLFFWLVKLQAKRPFLPRVTFD